MDHLLPGLLTGVMYISIALVLLAPLIAKNPPHRQSIRRRATFVWLVSTGAVIALYFRLHVEFASLAEAIVANIGTMIILIGGERLLREVRRPRRPDS